MPNAIILSGIRPTGKLHLGNYLGALQHFVRLQAQHTGYFFIADLHTLNAPYEPVPLHASILDTVAWFLAAGLDPQRSTLFIQSQVPQHCQLAVVLANVVPVGYLFRMTQFKDKAGGTSAAQDRANAGLLYYPVLMAADILLYHPAAVPVGDDQDQHVELTRDLAGFFNRRFGATFTPPKTLHTAAPRVMSLLDPTKKMSKSLGGNHCLNLDDTPSQVQRKLSRAVTDTGDGTGAGAKNLLELLRHFGEPTIVRKVTRDAKAKTIRYAELKTALAEAISRHLAPIQQRHDELLADATRLERILADGAKRARTVAEATLDTVYRQIGFRPR